MGHIKKFSEHTTEPTKTANNKEVEHIEANNKEVEHIEANNKEVEHIEEAVHIIKSEERNGIVWETRGDEKASEDAREMVGDGKDPAMFFVSWSNDYMFHGEEGLEYFTSDTEGAPFKMKKIITSYLPVINNWEEAKKKAEAIELFFDEKNEETPMHVIIEDRKSGTAYERVIVLSMDITSDEEILDNGRFAEKIYNK